MLNLFQSKTQEPLDRRTSLNGIPVLHNGVSLDEKEEGRSVLTVEAPRSKSLLAYFLPPIVKRQYRLDELGTFVVKQVNGKRSVLQIINTFAKQYRVNRREAELSMVQFFKSLAGRKAISIVIR